MYETQKLDKETFINCKCLSKAIDDKIYPEAKGGIQYEHHFRN